MHNSQEEYDCVQIRFANEKQGDTTAAPTKTARRPGARCRPGTAALAAICQRQQPADLLIRKVEFPRVVYDLVWLDKYTGEIDSKLHVQSQGRRGFYKLQGGERSGRTHSSEYEQDRRYN